MEEMLNLQTALISDTWLPILVREKALQANVCQQFVVLLFIFIWNR